MNKFDILWEGEYVSVVSPVAHPYETLHEINGIMVIPIVKNKIGIRKELVPPYLLKDETGKEFYYTVISGGVKEGESPEDATTRELKEEAGIEFKDPEITEVFREMPVCKSSDMRMTFFIYADDEYKLETPEGDGTEYEDIAETIWITLDQFKEVINKDNIDFLLYSAYYFLTVYLKKQEKTMESNLTIKHLGNFLYQIDDNTVPINSNTLRGVLSNISSLEDSEITKWIDDLESKGTKELMIKTGERGVIVDLYEVDYTFTDPMKETQELARQLDEKKDFVTQYLFPGSTTEEVLIGLRQDLLPDQKEPPLEVASSFFKIANQKEMSVEEKNYILRTGMMPPYVLEESFGITSNNWMRFKFKKEGKVVDSLIGGDVLRYLVAVQADTDIEHFFMDYKNLVLAGMNPLDFVSIIEATQKRSRIPERADEDITIDKLISLGDFEVRNVFAIKGRKNE